MKKCANCLEVKSIFDFPKNHRSKDLLDTNCKLCRNLKNKKYRDCNSDKVKSSRKKYYASNIQKMREEKTKYYQKNKDKKAAYDKIYRTKNKKKLNKQKKDWEKRRLLSGDHTTKIAKNLRRRINHVLKGTNKSASTIQLLGCSIEQFLVYLESMFLENMSWDNYGTNGWHIDHIRPCSSFNLNDENDQKKCFHYSNLRPLWAIDNLKKGKLIINPDV